MNVAANSSAALLQNLKALLEKYGNRFQLTHLKGMRDTTPTGLTFLSRRRSSWWTRNPLYLAGLGVFLGVACFVNGIAPFILFVPLVALLYCGIVCREAKKQS